MEVGEEVVRALGAGFDLTSDFRLRFAKAAARRLVELDEEEARRDLPLPGAGGATLRGVPGDVVVDKGDRIRFRSDVLQFNQVLSSHPLLLLSRAAAACDCWGISGIQKPIEGSRVGSPAPPGLSRPGNFGGWSEGIAACRGGNYACRSRVVRSSLSNSSARREGAQVRFLLPHFARFAPPPPNALGIASSGRKRWRMSSVLAPARLMPTAHRSLPTCSAGGDAAFDSCLLWP
jgi:hypothetical protein